MDLVAGDEVCRRNAERRRHPGAILAHVIRRIARSDAAIEALVDALRYPALAREEGMADVGMRGEASGLDHKATLTASWLTVKPGQHAELWVGKRQHLEQLAH